MDWINRRRIEFLKWRANDYYQSKMYPQAMRQYSKMRTIYPKWDFPVSGISLCYYHLKKYDDAIEFIDIANELNPKDNNHLFNKILFLRTKGELREALSLSNELVRKENTNPTYLFLNFELLIEFKQYEKAYEISLAYVKLSNDRQYTYWLISDKFSDCKEFQKSINILILALIEAPENEIALNNLGYNRLKTREYEKAILAFDKAIELEEYAFAYNNKGFAKLKLGKTKEAIENIEHSISLDNTNSYAFKNKALYYIEIGDKFKALENLEIAKKLGFESKYGTEVNELIERVKNE